MKPSDLAQLEHPHEFFASNIDSLVILDEIHRAPEVFSALRSIIDEGRSVGRRTGRVLILGSATISLLRQTSESLAGRIAFCELTPFVPSEVVRSSEDLDKLWVRGGYPESYLATSDESSFEYRTELITTYINRDIPEFGPRIPSTTMFRLWRMLAHLHGSTLNSASIARSLEVSAHTVNRYIDLLSDLFLVRRLEPLHGNLGKRLVRSPKVYLRDSGVLHSLLGLADWNGVHGHPQMGSSWEGFVTEALLEACPKLTLPSFYRTQVGAEIDLLLEFPQGHRWAIEIKRSPGAKTSRGFLEAIGDVKPDRAFVVHGQAARYPMREGIEGIGLMDMLAMLRAG